MRTMTCFNAGVHDAHGWTSADGVMQCPGHSRPQPVRETSAPPNRACTDPAPHDAHTWDLNGSVFGVGVATPVRCPGVNTTRQVCVNPTSHPAHFWVDMKGRIGSSINRECPGVLGRVSADHWVIQAVLDAAEGWENAHVTGTSTDQFRANRTLIRAIDAYKLARS